MSAKTGHSGPQASPWTMGSNPGTQAMGKWATSNTSLGTSGGKRGGQKSWNSGDGRLGFGTESRLGSRHQSLRRQHSETHCERNFIRRRCQQHLGKCTRFLNICTDHSEELLLFSGSTRPNYNCCLSSTLPLCSCPEFVSLQQMQTRAVSNDCVL